MNKIINKFGFLLVLFLFFTACKNEPKPSLQNALKETEVAVDKSFMPFYNQFHSDKAYQLDHVQFPLQGLPGRIDSAELAAHSSYIQKEDWIFQGALEEDSGFSREMKVITPGMVEEFVINAEQTFGIRRRFAKLAGDWYLIYYAKGPIKQ